MIRSIPLAGRLVTAEHETIYSILFIDYDKKINIITIVRLHRQFVHFGFYYNTIVGILRYVNI